MYINEYCGDIKEYNARERVRRRRRKHAGLRRNKPTNGKGAGRIYGKAIRVLIIIAVCFATLFVGYLGAYNSIRSDTGLSYTAQAEETIILKTVTVHSGDTLWGIASRYSEPSKDIRKQIREICELNGVKAGEIYPGQLIIVPVPAHLE